MYIYTAVFIRTALSTESQHLTVVGVLIIYWIFDTFYKMHSAFKWPYLESDPLIGAYQNKQ